MHHYVPLKLQLNIPSPPGQPLGHLNFLKSFVQISPSPGRKAVEMTPPSAKLPDYCYNFSEASIMLLKLGMYTWFIGQHPYMPRDSAHISYKFEAVDQIPHPP